MKNVDLHHGAATDVGLVRKVNEDSYLVAPPIFVVADGMGGHSGGDVASQMVVEEFQRLSEVYDPVGNAPGGHDTPPVDGKLPGRKTTAVINYGIGIKCFHLRKRKKIGQLKQLP